MVANQLWGKYDLVLADLDGVIYEGNRAIPNSVSSINSLVSDGIRVGYVTNNSSRRPQTIADQLNTFGLQVSAEQIISSGKTAVELLEQKVSAGAKVYVVGGEGLRSFVLDAGFEIVSSSDEKPAAVVQGFSPEVSWRELAEASYCIQNGAIWIASNSDWTLPQEKGVAPGNGTLVSAVHTAVGQFPIVAGKPESAIFETAMREFKTREALFIGDRLETDILGARRAEIDSAVVLTGIASRKDILAAKPDERANYILESLADLLEIYPALVQTKHGWKFNSTEVNLLGDKVLVTEGDPTSIDALRAACKVIWNADKHIHFLDVQRELYS